MDSDSCEILKSQAARALLGFEADSAIEDLHSCSEDWTQYISQKVGNWPNTHELLVVAIAAHNAFLQANVTGPLLRFDSAKVIFPSNLFDETSVTVERLRKQLISSLSVDGEAVYQLIPNIELFCLANAILNHVRLVSHPRTKLARLRVNFWHQRLLGEASSTLQERIYTDLDSLSRSILIENSTFEDASAAQFLIERATIHIHHGFDGKARDDLTRAAQERSFNFVLTGRLGKRTKFQEKELSQLVVLAKSADSQQTASATGQDCNGSREIANSNSRGSEKTQPQALNLNDDTLLESISFSTRHASPAALQAVDQLPSTLQSLDPGNQPLLDPLDAVILLAIASSVTNTSPKDGLTREETLPYAERVISGGSSNWQVYTQALLVRSRIEGYRSRTIERGVLQLQAVVDQVIAETNLPENPNSGSGTNDEAHGSTHTSFLPQPKRSESASISERLQYIHQLASPPRWKLESELADRWVSLGGLRTALEIYERLQMWAEVALCWASNDREDKARKILRRQLYNPVITTSTEKLLEDDDDNDCGDYRIERNPLPADAPRLFCILGDMEKSVPAYERSWEISNYRYARAQRSLGKLYSATGDLSKADEAYTKSLKVNPQSHTTWFALGCVRLQTQDWPGAVNAFGRTVQIEDTDAESWSNLAVALLKFPPDVSLEVSVDSMNDKIALDDEQEKPDPPVIDPQKHVREAFVALKRAAALKRDSFRIWQNLLSVSVKLSPPPYTDIVVAQTRLIELLGKLEGEKCVDIEITEALVAHIIVTSPSTSAQQSDAQQTDGQDLSGVPPSRRIGLEKMVIDLVQKKITPLITSSRRLWDLTAKLSLHLGHPSATLSAYEKAWRVTLNQPGWETGGGSEAMKTAWREVVDSTIDLADAYESLGERTRESGMGAGELVARDWRFKARSALRSVLSKARDGWESEDDYETLNGRLQELKSA